MSASEKEFRGLPGVESFDDSKPTSELQEIKVAPDNDGARVDPELAKYTSEKAVVIDEATNKRLKTMIDKRVLSIMICTYFLQALDKGTLSFASIMGIRDDAGLVGQQYSWLTTCIYIAVLIVEYPTNFIITKVPIAKYLGVNIILWGSVLALHASCRNFAGLVAVRTLLGIFEACCQPIFVLLSSMWYKREEQAQTVAYWYMMNGGQQIVGGILSSAFTKIPQDSPIKGWQALFMAYGIASVFWGFFVLFWMPDSPMRAKCWSEEDKKLMVERVRSNQTGMQNKQFRKEQVWEAFKDPQMYCFALIQIFTTLPTSGLGAFANIIIMSFKFTIFQTQLLAMVLGAYLIIVLMSSAWIAKKTNQTVVVMAAYVIPSIIGTVILMTVVSKSDDPLGKRVGLLISYYVCLSFWATTTLCLSLVSRNVAGQTKKSVVITVNFIAWAVGNSIGPQVFLAWDAPRYFIAFSVHMVCYGLLLLVLVFLRWHYARMNKKKAQALAEGRAVKDEGLSKSFDDLTDFENPNFVYIL